MAAKSTPCLSAFPDKATPPSEADLRRVLGAAAPLWADLVVNILTTYEPGTMEWKHAGARYGWSLRLKRKERVILYLTPQRRSFLAGIVLGDRAVAATRAARLPAAVASAIAAARRYAEGTGVRLPVTSRRDLEAIETLVELKMER